MMQPPLAYEINFLKVGGMAYNGIQLGDGGHSEPYASNFHLTS